MGRSPARGAARPAAPRPRYRRITAAAGSLFITVIAVLGGVGWLPADAEPGRSATAKSHGAGHASGAIRLSGAASVGTPPPADQGAARAQGAALPPPVPGDSGRGRRVVFDMSDQRVWLVAPSDQGADAIRRNY